MPAHTFADMPVYIHMDILMYICTYIYVRTYVRNVLSLVVGSALVVVAVIADEPLCHKKCEKRMQGKNK